MRNGPAQGYASARPRVLQQFCDAGFCSNSVMPAGVRELQIRAHVRARSPLPDVLIFSVAANSDPLAHWPGGRGFDTDPVFTEEV